MLLFSALHAIHFLSKVYCLQSQWELLCLQKHLTGVNGVRARIRAEEECKLPRDPALMSSTRDCATYRWFGAGDAELTDAVSSQVNAISMYARDSLVEKPDTDWRKKPVVADYGNKPRTYWHYDLSQIGYSIDLSQVNSSLFHHTLKSMQAGNSKKTMWLSKSTVPFSNT